MKNGMLILALFACASTPKYTPPQWSDSQQEQRLLECAAALIYTPEIVERLKRVRVFVRPGHVFSGVFEPSFGGSGGIFMDANARSAVASPWDHEWVHAAVYFQRGQRYDGGRCRTDSVFLAAEAEFKAAYAVCRASM